LTYHLHSKEIAEDLIYYLDTKRWWPILEQSFKFAGVLWLLEWSICEKLCLVGKINQYASEWQQRLVECAIFYIFFKSETELVVAWLRWSLHPLLVYMVHVYRPCDLYESDSSPCEWYSSSTPFLHKGQIMLLISVLLCRIWN
jgi:hypothetical protein